MAPRPTPILALDVPDARRALALVDRLPRAEWVKVGLQLFIAAGPKIVRDLRERERRIFLDLKLHDIPNTVARAAEAAAELGVELLTLHASGGSAMLRAARDAVGEESLNGPRLLAVTVLTSLGDAGLAEAWGRSALSAVDEVDRLTGLALDVGIDGVVASAMEAPRIRQRAGDDLLIVAPGIRLSGDAAGDQTRVATPADATRLGVDFLVVGRTVTAAPDPVAAFDAVLAQVAAAAEDA